MSLVARQLEEAGMPTVVMGAGRDIVEHAGVPRFLFTDFPLGNPVGRPGDAPMQRQCVEMAFDLFEHAFAPRTTVQTPFVWSEDHEWRDQYMRVDESNQAELARLGAQRRDDQAAAKTDGRARSA